MGKRFCGTKAPRRVGNDFREEIMNIAVIGMGYVGIPCAALLADAPGMNVTGVQRRSGRSGWKIDCLNSGRSPFAGEEPGLADLIWRVVREKATLRVTEDYSVCRDAQVILIDVQTPTDGDHVPQYESLREVSAQVGRYLQPGTLVILESTVAPGTTQNIVQPILERESGLKAGNREGDGEASGSEGRFYLAFSYERVMPGKLLEYITDFPRVVGGVDGESAHRALDLYRNIARGQLAPTDVLTAEMAKVVENAYRDVNIAFANEVALACEQMGVDVFELRQLVNARPDRHMHVPGAGVGGHCLPKDSWLLKYGLETYGKPGSSELGVGEVGSWELRLIPLAREINDRMPGHVYALVEEALAEAGRDLVGAKIVLLGASYLENADDTRNAPAAALARLLVHGGADVVVHDPHVRSADWSRAYYSTDDTTGPAEVPLTADLWWALEEADCAVLVTKHREYGRLDLQQVRKVMRHPVLVDGRNGWDPSASRAAGIHYRGVGKA
jgi:UDP-N-acetyl-D-mannosaminuronic acid dehydrogenase